MATTLSQIRIEALVTGVEKTIADLKALEAAQGGVSRTSDETAKGFANSARAAEKIKATYIEGYGAAQRFTQELTQISRALEVGALSTDDAALAMAGLKARMESVGSSAIVAANHVRNMGAVSNSELRMAGFAAQNLTFQINDIATGLLTGQSPFMVMMQQSGQLSQILGANGGGLKGALSLVGTAAMSMLTPVNLAIVGFGVAAAAAASFFSDAEDGAKATEEALKRNADVLDMIKEKYGAAAEAALKMPGASNAVVQQAANSNADAMLRIADQERQAFLDSITYKRTGPEVGGVNVSSFADQIAALRSGKMTISEFADAVARLRDINKEAADTLASFSENAVIAADRFKRALIGASFVNGRPGGIGSDTARGGDIPYSSPLLTTTLPRINPMRDLTSDYGVDTSTKTDSFGELVRNADRRLQQLQQEQIALGLTGQALMQYRNETELLNEAQRAGIELTDAQKAQLSQVAQQMTIAQMQMKQLKDEQQAAAESGKFFGDTLEQALTGIMTGGDGAKKAIIALVAELAKAALLGEGPLRGLFRQGGLLNHTEAANDNPVATAVNAISGRGIGSDARFGTAGGGPVSDLLSRSREAIASIESAGSGGYSALGPITKSGDRAYGRYQVMGNNIPSWTRQAGMPATPEEFLANPGLQDRVFNQQFGGSLAKYGNAQDAASVWFTGRPLAQGAGAADILGTTGSQYVDKFNNALGKLSQTTTAATSTLGTFGQGLGQLGQSMGGAQGGGGGLFGWLGNLFGGAGSPAGSIGGLYASGGIANRASIFGEAGPEAAVPLPDGRSIPVKMMGGGQNGGNVYHFGAPSIIIQGNADKGTVDGIDKQLRSFEKRMAKSMAQREADKWRA